MQGICKHLNLDLNPITFVEFPGASLTLLHLVSCISFFLAHCNQLLRALPVNQEMNVEMVISL